MRKNNWARCVGLFLYDRQFCGKWLICARKSFQEVCHILKGERKKC